MAAKTQLRAGFPWNVLGGTFAGKAVSTTHPVGNITVLRAGFPWHKAGSFAGKAEAGVQPFRRLVGFRRNVGRMVGR